MNTIKQGAKFFLMTLLLCGTLWFLHSQYVLYYTYRYSSDEDRVAILEYIHSRPYGQCIRQEPGWYEDVGDGKYNCFPGMEPGTSIIRYIDNCNSMYFRIRPEDIPAVTKIITDEWGSTNEYERFKDFQNREINVHLYQGTYDPSDDASKEAQESAWIVVTVS